MLNPLRHKSQRSILSHPTRSSPLPHMQKVTDADDSIPSGNTIRPKARLSWSSRILPSPELHQHFVWDRLISHTVYKVNIRNLPQTTFVSGPKRLFCHISDCSGKRTKHRAHFVTRFIGTPFWGEPLSGDITNSFIMSSTNGKPAPQNTMFGLNLDEHQ